MFNLRNKRILITGASSGIGRQLAFELAKYNCRLILLSRNENQLKTVAKKILEQFTTIQPPQVVSCDISDEDAVKKAVAIITSSEKIDVLINNAGVGIYGPIKNTTPLDFEQIMKVNYLGAVNLTYHLLSHFRETSPALIVFVTSVASLYGIPCYGAYSASKAALRSFSQTLRSELVNTNISVLQVSPDYTKTRFFRNEKFLPGANLKRDKMASVEKVAAKIVRQIRYGRTETILSLRGMLLSKVYSFFPWIVRTYFQKRASKLLKN